MRARTLRITRDEALLAVAIGLGFYAFLSGQPLWLAAAAAICILAIVL